MKKFILDEIDHQILDILIENARTPFTDIAKKLKCLKFDGQFRLI